MLEKHSMLLELLFQKNNSLKVQTQIQIQNGMKKILIMIISFLRVKNLESLNIMMMRKIQMLTLQNHQMAKKSLMLNYHQNQLVKKTWKDIVHSLKIEQNAWSLFV
jgi:hypothetical protein